jgi:hypothetical protein
MKVWLTIMGNNPDMTETILDMLKDIISQIKQNKTNDEIKSHLLDKYEIITPAIEDNNEIKFSLIQDDPAIE